jgi:hypothetical protein
LHPIFVLSCQKDRIDFSFTIMNIKIVAALFVGTALLSSCNYQKYNKAVQKDVRAGSEWVYGVHPDSAARQLSFKYDEKPELELKANELRAKLYGDPKVYLK